MPDDPWLNWRGVRDRYLPGESRTTVWRRFCEWQAAGLPAVREQPRGDRRGGVELVVRCVELEAHLGLIPFAA